MSTTIHDPSGASSGVSSPAVDSADELVIRPVLSTKYALGLKHLGLTAVLGLLFLAVNMVGLRPTDLWCHVAYGEWILDHRALPTSDPFMPLSEGMKVVDTAWLSQVTLALVDKWGGAELLSSLFALTMAAAFTLLARTYFLQTQSVALTIVGLLSAVFVDWSRMWTIRPEMFAAVCFAALLWLIARSANRAGVSGSGAALLVGVPALFALWANLHGSFVCGLAVLGCYSLGAAIEAAWRRRDVRTAFRNARVRRWLVLCELAVLGSLCNPYLMDLLLNTLFFAGNENLRDVMEWGPLSLTGVGGVEFALSWVAIAVLFRHSRRRVSATDVLLLAVFSVAAAMSVRMIAWYAPVVVFVLLPHLADICRRVWEGSREPNALEHEPSDDDEDAFYLPVGRSFKYSLSCLLMVWICFALSPSSQRLLGGAPRTPEQVYQSQTPLGVSKYLREHPPQGLVFNPQHWGDWLVADGPADIKVFTTTMIHLIPAQVWRDYGRVSQAGPNWQSILERYCVTTLVIDKTNQPMLAGVIRNAADWSVAYEDEQGLVATRRGEGSMQATTVEPHTPAPAPKAKTNAAPHDAGIEAPPEDPANL